MGLTARERDHFDRLGYVVKPGVYSATDLAPLREDLARLIDAHAARLGAGRYHGPPMLAMIRHEPLLACIRDLVGDTIIGGAVYRIRPKAPAAPRGAVPWHRDSGYLLAHCDRYLIVTCWIPLVDANVENGCLYVIPGVHRQGIFRHYTEGANDYLEVPGDELPDVEAVPVEMAAGDVLFMTKLTPHASFENSSDVVRWSVDLRFQSDAPSNNVLEEPASYVPEREPITMACYPPEADFVISDPSAPERELDSPEKFEQIRAKYLNAEVHSPGRGWVSMTSRRDPAGGYRRGPGARRASGDRVH